MIFPPVIVLHENVGVLDYDSEYPNLILKYNISYETVDRNWGFSFAGQSVITASML
jgi:DNA polymerase elongation subunit (family B)